MRRYLLPLLIVLTGLGLGSVVARRYQWELGNAREHYLRESEAAGQEAAR